ncbi:IPExxxVDY family protein [Ochrovirga pacifica]|uniref:IPExxxVDY family protein n=1 Tax=Ochrovirga pacifica TaxID=1042376 RepID=UPI0002559537|nr:IPExxxVDY family protein [Ochrovirga pacifica]
MAAVIKFCDWIEDECYEIVGIHTTLQDYKLAYRINQTLNLNLHRIFPDVDFEINENDKAYFSVFEYHQNKSLLDWYLIKNKFLIKAKKSEGLFATEDSFVCSYVYLQPELKGVDFLLKIQGELTEQYLSSLLKKINTIEEVVTSYIVDKKTLNHKEHLIF